MFYIYIVLLFLLFCNSKFTKGVFNNDYLTKDTTNIVKGLFIAFVFLSHIQGYIQKSGYGYDALGDHAVLSFQNFMGQLVVVMFLFYSGYGIMESYKKKGQSYVSTMPRKRLARTLINLDIAVIIFIILNLFLGIPMNGKQCILSLIGWDSVGNSNWYIFVILVCYLISWLGLKISEKYGAYKGGLTYFLLSFIVYILLVLYKQSWWYDTFFCFSAGILFSIFKQKIQLLMDNQYWILLITCVLLFFVTKLLPYNIWGLKPNLNAVLFALTIVIFTRKIQLKSKSLCWMGKMLFPLYIYQRLPMIALYQIRDGGFVLYQTIFYVLFCGIITIIIAFFYKYISLTLK